MTKGRLEAFLIVALVRALGSDVKGKVSMALYALSIPLAFVSPYLSVAIFIGVAALWFVPDRRLEAHH